VTDILTNDEISLLRSLEKKSRTITGYFTHKRYDRLETKGYIKRSSQPPSMQDILYEITDAGKAALRAVGGAADEIRTKTVLPVPGAKRNGDNGTRLGTLGPGTEFALRRCK
jgi:DNA-binding HxlR family transcriptional regulator